MERRQPSVALRWGTSCYALLMSVSLVLLSCGSATAPGAATRAHPTGDAGATSARIAATTTPAPPTQAEQPTHVLVAANSTSVNHIWPYWGLNRGIYRRYGLDVETVDNVSDAAAALASDQVDFVAHGVQVHSAAVKGLPVRAVMVTFRDNLGVFADARITTIEDLHGTRIVGQNDIVKELL